MRKTFAAVIFSFTSLIGILFLISVIFEYRPDPVEILKPEGAAKYEKAATEITLLTWNIGYCGLGKDADFFMDGGRRSHPESKAVVKKNLDGISDIASEIKRDINLFQEVDVSSHRSYIINEFQVLKKLLLDFELYFSVNFRVWRVPVPLADPIGKVHSGVVTASVFKAENAQRYSLASVDSWPEKLFHLKRCMLVSRYIKSDGKELVVVNIHLSAYDDGKIRKEQMKKLRKIIVSEYQKGNSVIVGGDWNQRMPGVRKDQFGKYTTDEKYLAWAQKIDEKWTPKGWKWVYDGKVPTVRNNESAYREGVNFTTVIDGFLVSPDVEVVDVETVDMSFRYSDHNPVVMKVKIPGGNDEK